ncbi:MAG: hypothetical protein ACOYK9_02425 [Chlamydiia bacterium]
MSSTETLGFSPSPPDWFTSPAYTAQTTYTHQVNRLANYLSVVTSFLGVCALLTGRAGLLVPCASIAIVARKMTQVALGYLCYPAALQSLSSQYREELELTRETTIGLLEAQGFIINKITFKTTAANYSGLLISSTETINNGRWVIHAFGNCGAWEDFAFSYGARNSAIGCNTLVINGPSVGLSGGWPSRHQLGAGFEAGLQFLEEKVQASHIIMEGLSLGGGMMGEAITQHNFDKGLEKGTQYLSITDRSFNYLSSAAACLSFSLAKYVFVLAGMELDGVKAAKKLSRLQIKQIVINNKHSDTVIRDGAILANTLQEIRPTLDHMIFLKSKKIEHNLMLPIKIQTQLDQHIQEFLALSADSRLEAV